MSTNAQILISEAWTDIRPLVGGGSIFKFNAQLLVSETWIDISLLVDGGSIQVQMLKYWFQKHGLI